MDGLDHPRTVLIYHDGSGRADQLLHLAFRLLGAGSHVVVLAITVVHPTLPLRGLPADVDVRADGIVHRVEELASSAGQEIETRVARGRGEARVIIREACAIEADVIVLPWEPRRAGGLYLGMSRTVRDVLHHAPCPVFLGYLPFDDAWDAAEVVAEAERLVGHV